MYNTKANLQGYLVTTFLIFCCISKLVAQDEATTYKIDSLVYKYYQKCKDNVKDSIVLAMSDTLFQMAEKKEDQRMQAVALSTKVDYYYFQGTNEDSIIAYVSQVKKFAQRTKQPKYYYFIWGKRLITYYIKQGKTNIALFEVGKMLKEAQAENYKEGIAACYNCLSNIYITKGLLSKAMLYQLKQIELHEKYNLENYNIALLYGEVADRYLEKNQPEKALEMIKKGEKTEPTISQLIRLKLRYVDYYLITKDTLSAWKALQDSREKISKDSSFTPFMNALYETELSYYNATKQYAKALAVAELRLKKTPKETSTYISLLLEKGNIYWHLNRKDEAAACYQAYIEAAKNIREENEEIATGEFATLLNVQQLNAEKNEIQHQAQEKQLVHNRTIIILLVCLLIIVLIFFYRENLSNKKLKLSKQELINKNEILEQSEMELSKAKEIAEQASRMKTSFIQNMSHEIRTPLNSIVGFSQVLTNFYSENDEAKEFSEIIEKNSNLLLKLITDVLCIANLDQMDKITDTVTADLHDCCMLSVELTRPDVKSGVLLQFNPPYPKLLAQTNPEQVSQILFNLLSNAAKFTTTGEIVLAYILFEEKGIIEFTVRDTGIGIPVEQQERVFERFFKINDFEQGTGLGLPISRLIAEKMEGTLVIDKEYKKGSRFVLTLPYHPV